MSSNYLKSLPFHSELRLLASERQRLGFAARKEVELNVLQRFVSFKKKKLKIARSQELCATDGNQIQNLRGAQNVF